MNWLHYLLEANIYLGVFYIAYCLLLNQETHYLLNRVYLVSSCVISFILPLLQIGLLKAPVAPPPPMMPATFIEAPVTGAPIAIAPIAEQSFNWQEALWYIYVAGAAIFALLFIIKLISLARLVIGKSVFKHTDYNLIYIDESQTAFSFFNYLFIGKNTADEHIITRHELVHIRQKHSADIIFLEVLKIISWFNPLIYLIQSSLKTVHEYIADEQSVDSPTDAITYSSFLVNNAYGLTGPSITHSFFTYNILKKRIIMLNQQRSGNLARLKYLVAVPIGAALLCASTLGFSKTYGWIDLAPRKADKTTLEASAPVNESTYTGLLKYIKNNMRYTAADSREPTEVFADITITPNHKITDVKSSKWIHATVKSSLQPKVLELINSYPELVYDKPGKYIITAMFNLDGEEKSTVAYGKLSGYTGQIVLNIPQPLPPPSRIVQDKQIPPKPKIDKIRFPPVLVPAGFKPEKTYVNAKGFKIEEGMGRTKTNFTYYVVIISDPTGKELKVANDGGEKRFVVYKGMPGVEKIAYSEYGYKFPDVKVSRFVGPPPYQRDVVRFPPPIVKPNKATSPKPKADQIKFPPPIVKPNKNTPPKPKVDQVRFPPPSVLRDGANDIIGKKFMGYLLRNIRYPQEAYKNDIGGNIITQFTIDDNHNLTAPAIVSGIDHGCDEEVLRVLNNYKDKLPGKAGTYKIGITMYLDNGKTGMVPRIENSILNDPNFLGQMVVTAYQHN